MTHENYYTHGEYIWFASHLKYIFFIGMGQTRIKFRGPELKMIIEQTLIDGNYKQENNIDKSILRGESRMIKKPAFKNSYMQQKFKNKHQHLG